MKAKAGRYIGDNLCVGCESWTFDRSHHAVVKCALLWRRYLLATLGTIVGMALVPSHEAVAQVVVFVSVGEPSKETVRLLAPYLDEMSRRPFVVALPKDIRARLGTRVPRPGRADPGMQVSDLVMRYDDGLAHFRKNQWKEAAAKLNGAIAASRDNAALLADETSHRETWMRGLIALAMSRHRLHDDAGADEAMEGLARTYPNQLILVQALSGSEAARYYAAAQTRLETRGRGRLIVQVREQAARVYLDMDDRPQNGVLEAEVLPGPHRVLVRMPGTDGQLYDAVVNPGKVTTLMIDLRFGEAFSITDRYVGLVFSSQSDRDQYALDYAAQFAAAVDAYPEMTLVERTTLHGQPAFKSVIYMADSGGWVRGRVTSLSGRDDDDRMRALARETFHGYHIEDTRIVDLPDPALLRAQASTRRGWMSRGWMKWSAGAGAAVMLTTGGAALYLHQTCGPDAAPCRSGSPTLAYASLAAGTALGVVAMYLFLSDRPSPHAPHVSVQPTSGGALVGLSLAY